VSFQVTARRWRPQAFDEVVGQEHVTSTLKSAIENDRVAHAYLFAGTRGVGKTTSARILAKAINCEQGPTSDPCGECAPCVEVVEGGSMDVIEIDGASNRGIEEIRNLRENVRYAPSRGRYKVYIIDEVHMLTIHAFNALLKTLEEPPPYVVFILATTEVAKVPATIVSRCQRFDFRLIPQSKISEQLKEINGKDSLGVPPEVLEIIARSARGSMRDAQSLLDQLVSYCAGQVTAEEVMAVLGMVDYDVLSTCVDALLSGDAATLLGQVEEIRANGRDPRLFCGQLLRYLRDLVVIKASGEAASLPEVPPERRETMEAQIEGIPLSRIQLLFSLLAQAESDMIGSSYPDLVMEMALVKMSRTESFMSLDEILSRLEEIEGKMGGGSYGPLSEVSDEQESLPLIREQEAGRHEERVEESPVERMVDKPLVVEERPAPEDSKKELWQRILDEAKKMNHLVQYLAQGWLAEVSEDAVEIAFPKEYSFTAQLLKSSGKLSELQEVVCSALGRRVRVSFADGETDADDEDTDEEVKETPGPWNPLSEPLVRHMLDMFEGRIVDRGKEQTPF
jgi:DNA polymerase-3 subunit gamma/tau